MNILTVVLNPDETEIAITMSNGSDVRQYVLDIGREVVATTVGELYDFACIVGADVDIPWNKSELAMSGRESDAYAFGNESRCVIRRLEDCDEDPIFDAIRSHIGLFTQYLVWLCTTKAYKRVIGTGSELNLNGTVASASISSFGASSMQPNWLQHVTVERPTMVSLTDRGARVDLELEFEGVSPGDLGKSVAPPMMMAKMYQAAIDSARSAMWGHIDRFRYRIETLGQRAFGDAVATLQTVLIDPRWKLKDNWLVFEETIEATSIMYYDRLYDLPDEYEGLFYIDSIRLKPAKTIELVMATGFHPHLAGSDPDHFNDLCVGEIAGTSIENILSIPESLTVINYDSMWGNSANDYIEYLVNDDGDDGTYCDIRNEYPDLSNWLDCEYECGLGREIFEVYDE